MTIPDALGTGKGWLGRIPTDALLAAILVLVACTAFWLGVMSGKEMAREGMEAEEARIGLSPFLPLPEGGGPAAAAAATVPVSQPERAEPQAPSASERVYMASKNGEKYYLPTCGSAKRIKEENRVWFATKEEAESLGYQPASNCPGL